MPAPPAASYSEKYQNVFWSGLGLGLVIGVPLGVAIILAGAVLSICREELGRWWHAGTKI